MSKEDMKIRNFHIDRAINYISCGDNFYNDYKKNQFFFGGKFFNC